MTADVDGVIELDLVIIVDNIIIASVSALIAIIHASKTIYPPDPTIGLTSAG